MEFFSIKTVTTVWAGIKGPFARWGGARRLREAWRSQPVRTQGAPCLTISLARLDGDSPDGALSRAMHRSMEQALGSTGAAEDAIVLRAEARGVSFDFGGRGLGDARRQVESLFQETGADILIAGEARPEENAAFIRFYARESADRAGEQFALEKMLLEGRFADAAGAVLLSECLAMAAPAVDRAGTYLVPLLRPVATKLKRIAETPPPGLSGAALGRVWFSLGLALGGIGGQAGDAAALSGAIEAYRRALLLFDRGENRDDWAATQNNLGNALAALGERESGTTQLEDAVAAYRAALEERARERVPLDWATTQNNLGNALQTLGERESGTARLEDAVAAYRAALEEYTREWAPLKWAMTQNNLGTALRTLGERESGTARLEDAVAAYRAALEERTRARVPLNWAMTQNNLGNALSTLGERESGTARLEDAVAAYRAALEERTRERVPLNWAATQNNLSNALFSIARKTRDPSLLHEAIGHYDAALTVMREAGASYYVEIYEQNRANATAFLAGLEAP